MTKILVINSIIYLKISSNENSYFDSKHVHEKWGLSKPYASLNLFNMSKKTWRGQSNSLKYNLWCLIDLRIWCNKILSILKDLISLNNCFLNFSLSSSTTLLMSTSFALCNGPFLITPNCHSLSLLLPMNVREWTLKNHQPHVFLRFPAHCFHFKAYLKA